MLRTPHQSSTALITHRRHNYKITLLWIQFTDILCAKSLVNGTEIQNNLENGLKVLCRGERQSTHQGNRKTVKFADKSADEEGDRCLQKAGKVLCAGVEYLLIGIAKLPRTLRLLTEDFDEC